MVRNVGQLMEYLPKMAMLEYESGQSEALAALGEYQVDVAKMEYAQCVKYLTDGSDQGLKLA
jgi:hypothetical protein